MWNGSLDLKATSKDEAIAVDEFSEQLLSHVLEREALTSTVVDRGVAIPHARSEQVEGVVVSLGIHRSGLDFGSPNGDPVHLVFLVLSAPTATPAYLSILGRTARIFRSEQMLQSVLGATGAEQIVKIIAAHEPS